MNNIFGRLGMAVVFMIAAGAASACFGQVTGGWGDADPADKDVVKAAKFAAKTLGTDESATVSVVKIENARLQVVAGINYEICMTVTIKRGVKKKAAKRNLRAVIYKDLKNRFSLTNWTVSTDALKCGD